MVVVLSHGRYYDSNWWAWVPETTTVRFYVDHATVLSSFNIYAVLASGELGPPSEEISGAWCRNYSLTPLEANLISSYQRVNEGKLDLHFVESATDLCGMATDPEGEGEAASRYCDHAQSRACGGLLQTLGAHKEIVILACRAVEDTDPEDMFGSDPLHWQADFTVHADRFVEEFLALANADEAAAMEQLETLDDRDIEILRGAVPDFARWYDARVTGPADAVADSIDDADAHRPPDRPDDAPTDFPD